jgi:hypothetical protein
MVDRPCAASEVGVGLGIGFGIGLSIGLGVGLAVFVEPCDAGVKVDLLVGVVPVLEVAVLGSAKTAAKLRMFGVGLGDHLFEAATADEVLALAAGEDL